VIAELCPQLLLLLGVGEGGRLVNAPLSRSGGAGAGRRSLGAVPSATGHHVAVPPSHECPRQGLGGWHGQVHPLVPPGRRDVVVWDFHRHRLGAANEGGLRPRAHDHFWPRLRGRGLLLRRRGSHLRLRLSGRGRWTALHNKRCRQCHYNRRRRLCLRPRSHLCCSRRLLRLHHDWRPPLLSNRRLRLGGRDHRLWPRGLSRALRALARCCRRARPRPRRP
jgi:hypothetical protein